MEKEWCDKQSCLKRFWVRVMVDDSDPVRGVHPPDPAWYRRFLVRVRVRAKAGAITTSTQRY